MTLTLKSAIDATQTTIDVNGTDTLSNGDLYSIEDEQVFIVTASTGDVQPGQTAWQRLNVQRGQLGTTEVGHTAGTVLTAVGIPLGSGGGAAQNITLLGPFPVVFDSAGIGTSAGTTLTTAIPAGAAILTAWAEVTAEWNFGESVNADIKIAPNSDLGNSNRITRYSVSVDPFDWAVMGDATQAIEASHANGSTAALRTRLIRVLEESRLSFATTPATATTGAANIFAFIAEPA